MLQKKCWWYALAMAGLCFAIAPKGQAQSIFRIGAWCLRGDAIKAPDPVYTNSRRQLSLRGPERDKLLNLGLNSFFGCVNLAGEEALVFMGDSLHSAPVRKEFKTVLMIVPGSSQPPIANFWPDTMSIRELRRKALTAFLYNSAQRTQRWQDSVVYGYRSLRAHYQNRLNGVLAFFVAAEGCINTTNHIPGINFMAQNAILDAVVELGYVRSAPWDCHTAKTYDMAKRLIQVDHLMSGGYYLSTTTPYSGRVFQDSLNTFVGSVYAAARGIRDRSSNPPPVNTTLWAIVQTQAAANPRLYPKLRLPTKAEILCQVNLSLAAGAKAISYYPYSTLVGSNETGLLTTNRDTTRQYNNVRAINLNYQDTDKSLASIGANFLKLIWHEGVSVYQNTNEPINSAYKLYDVTTKPPSGAIDPENQTYVEVGILQNASNINHYMVVNRRCTASEKREVTLTFQSTIGNAYRITDVVSGESATYFPAGSTFAHIVTLGPGQGKLLKLE